MGTTAHGHGHDTWRYLPEPYYGPTWVSPYRQEWWPPPQWPYQTITIYGPTVTFTTTADTKPPAEATPACFECGKAISGKPVTRRGRTYDQRCYGRLARQGRNR